MTEESTSARRLGKRELGRHANEARMPAWLLSLLNKHAFVEHAISGLVDLLGQLSEQDNTVKAVYLCHSSVQYIGKIKRREGHNFCGYHNIQMQLSYLRGAKAPGYEEFEAGIPSILNIQDLIETAWDKGYNTSGRVHTGGISGTRKHIGTPEAQALFRSLSINCRAAVFHGVEDGKLTYERLLDFVENYFFAANTPQEDTRSKVRDTILPPIYLQRPRHSVTIVGLEMRKNGSRNLLVFDPAFSPSKAVRRLVSSPSKVKHPDALLRDYRRTEKQLKRFNAFETLRLTG